MGAHESLTPNKSEGFNFPQLSLLFVPSLAAGKNMCQQL